MGYHDGSENVKDYAEFLETKRRPLPSSGIEPGPIHESLYPFQKAIVEWAIRKGRAAVFADCGLGKTRIQLEWARQMGERTLIVAPLCVADQTIREAHDIGIDEIRYVKEPDDSPGIQITNYERTRDFLPGPWDAIVLDESSILKSYMGKTKRQLVRDCASIPFRLCCTATPAPNDHMELGNHAEFLGVLGSNEMLARWFIADPMQAGNYRIKAHARRDFWSWVHSWAVSLEKPSDMGRFDDAEFSLPDLTIHEHIADVPHNPAATGLLFAVPGSLNATDLHRVMRATATARAEQAAVLVNAEPGVPWVIWCHTNYEADALKEVLPSAIDVRGSDTLSEKEESLRRFTFGDTDIIITKPTIAGFGLNWQHCARVIFVGLSYSYEQFYQAIRRTWRFGQKRGVHAHLISTTSDQGVRETILKKERAHEVLKSEMTQAMRRIQVERDDSHRPAPKDRSKGNRWILDLGDACTTMPEIEDESVGISVFSPPFSNLYIYTDHIEDLGNTVDDAEFFEHFRFIVRELHRVTKTGRIAAVHCKDLPRYKGRDGSAGLRDFPGQIIRLFEEEGWTYHSRVTIWKDPVIEMQRTKNHGLLYKQLRKDSSASRMGMADFVVAFRKWGDIGVNGDSFPDPVEHEREDFPLDRWQAWASPVWDDVRQTRVLQYRDAKGPEDERHICPLQLDVIERCIMLWSNPGDLVFSPFAGIGSEGYEAVRLGRRFHGIELKADYYRIAVKNLAAAESEVLGGLFAGTETA